VLPRRHGAFPPPHLCALAETRVWTVRSGPRLRMRNGTQNGEHVQRADTRLELISDVGTGCPRSAAVCEGFGMRVVSLHTYPVKGCHRVDHEEIAVQPWGVVGDRRWLIVDEDGGAVTQGEVPELTGLRATITVDGGLRLNLPDRDDLTIAEPVPGELVPISVFAYHGQATLADPKADEWLTAGLDRPVRLVWQDDPGRRAPGSPNARVGDRMMFQDDFPVSLANLASLAALNDLIAESGSLEGPLPITRFRPNIVLAEAEPWAEDAWTGGRLRIGEATFHVPEGSGRCLVTTTDQETGERGHEPLRTLGRHRNVNQRLLFATLLVPEGSAKVHVGDTLEPL
jgi:uncharacterized protein